MQVELILDPNDHYCKLGDGWQFKVIEALGILPEFLGGAGAQIADNMERNYQFFSHWSTGQGAEVRGGCFCYPGDPEQHPLLTATHDNETIYFYPCCIVAQVVDGKLVKWTRMD